MRLTWRCLSDVSFKISKALDHYSRFQPSILSIQQFIDFGKQPNAGDRRARNLHKKILAASCCKLLQIAMTDMQVSCTCVTGIMLQVYSQLVPKANLTLALTLSPNSESNFNFNFNPCPKPNPNTNPVPNQNPNDFQRFDLGMS